MSDATADWIAVEHILHLGELGADWVSLGERSGSEQITTFVAKHHNEALAALRQRAEQAEADAAVLRGLIFAHRNVGKQLAEPGSTHYQELLQQHYRAESVLYAAAERGKTIGLGLLDELEAARAVVEAARPGFGSVEEGAPAVAFDPVRLAACIAAYDAKRSI